MHDRADFIVSRIKGWVVETPPTIASLPHDVVGDKICQLQNARWTPNHGSAAGAVSMSNSFPICLSMFDRMATVLR